MDYSRMNFPCRICGRSYENWARLKDHIRCRHQYRKRRSPSRDPTIRRPTHPLPVVGSRKRCQPREEITHAEGAPPQSPSTTPASDSDAQPNLAPPQELEIIEILELYETDDESQVQPETVTQAVQVEAISTMVATTQTKELSTESKSSQTRDDPEVERMFWDVQQILLATDGRAATMTMRHKVRPNTSVTYTYKALHLPDGTLYTKTIRENSVNRNQW